MNSNLVNKFLNEASDYNGTKYENHSYGVLWKHVTRASNQSGDREN